MGIGKRFDLQLNGKGFLLARVNGRRSWVRTGQSDSPSRRSPTDAEYGVLPDELDHPEVWDDWSGGYGQAYRRQGENTYHWAENFDARTPRQLVHCQNPQYLDSLGDAEQILDSTIVGVPNTAPAGYGNIILLRGALPFVALAPTATLPHLVIPTPVGQWVGNAIHGAGYGSFFYLADHGGTTFWRVAAADLSFTKVDSTDSAYRFQVVGNRLWRSFGAAAGKPKTGFYVANAANPNGVLTMANWSATYHVGNYAAAVQAMANLDDQIVLGTREGLYVGDQTGTFINVLTELNGQVHEDNCRDLAIYQGSVIVPHIAGVFRYRPNEYSAIVEDISPPRTDKGPVRGRFRAVRSYGRYLYAGLYTGSQSYLLSGEDSENGTIWHTLQKLPTITKISRVFIDGITTSSGGVPLPNRFWIATDASIDTGGTAPIYYWPIPMMDGNPLSPSPAFSANYVGSARMDLGSVDWGAPGTPKVYRALDVWADRLASGAQWADFYYNVDTGTRYLLGTVATSPKDTLYFNAEEGTTNLIKDASMEAASIGTSWGTVLNMTKSADYAFFGSNSAKYTATGPGGNLLQDVTYTAALYTFSCYVRRADGAVVSSADVQFSLNAAASNFDSITLIRDGWYRCVRTVAGTAATVSVGIRFNHATENCYADGIQFEAKPYVTSFCDGTRPHCAWTGTAHASTSVRQDGFISGQSIALSMQSFTASSAITPVYRALVLRGALRPRSVDQISAVVRIADGLRDRQGGEMRSGATMLAELRALAIANTPTTLIDLTGAQSYVSVLPPVTEQEVYQHGDEYPEVAATIQMAVLIFSGS